MDILVNVANQKLKIATNLKSLIAGTQEFVKFTFNLTGDWDDLMTFAQFQQNGVAYNQYLDENNSAYLPSEIGIGTCTLMLYGSNDKTIATTNYLSLTIDENILVSDANSTDISESLYTQLVTKVNTLLTWNEQNAADLQAVDKDLQKQINERALQKDLTTEIARAKAAEKANADAIALKASQKEVDDLSIKVTQLESNEVIASLIEAAVVAEMEEYLAAGTLANLTITDGSITRSKVDSAFNDILVKAENAMQPSVYDPQGLKVDVYSYAQARADTVQANLNKVKDEIKDAYVLTDTVYYTNLGDAIRGAVTLSRNYAQALLADYKAFTIEVVDELPLTGESMTFYLVPNESGTGYDKYWWIVDDNGDAKWDMFGGTSTMVVTELPVEGQEDIDYILKSSAGCLYYKWIDGVWEVVAGSIASVVSVLPETGNEFTDYYLLNESGSYIHHRYINGRFHTIGSDAYTRDEMNEKLAAIEEKMNAISSDVKSNLNKIQTNETNIAAVSRSVDTLRQDMNNLDVEGYTYYASYGKATLATGDEADNVFTLFEVKDDVENVKSQFVIAGGGGGGSTTTTNLVVERITQSPVIVTTTDKVEIAFNYSSTDSDGEQIDGTYTWKLGNQTLSSGSLVQGENKFDMTQYVNIGTQKFTLTVVDAGGSVVVKSWTVQIVDVRIDSTFSDRITYPIGSNVNFTYTPYGAVAKTVHFILDGVELESVTTTSSGTLQSYSLPAQTHGAHLLECYITATVNNMEIETDHIYKDIIWYDESSDVPVIGCIYRNDHYGNVAAKQYNTTSIPIYVFDPKTATPTITKSVNGNVVSTQTLTTANDVWAFKTSDVGTHTLVVSCKGTSVTIVMDVSELGIDVSPITANLAFDFNPTGLSNSGENRLWVDENTGVNLSVSNNFDWQNGGYQLDKDGNQYFCVKAGTTATINYNLFEDDASLYGSEFKFIFKTTNVKKADTSILSCLADTTAVGLRMDVHAAYLKSSVSELYIPYCEEDIIEFEFNINTLDKENADATSIIMSYEDGVGLRPMLYDATHRLYQYAPVPITIGSPDCDVHIYRMKAYKSALTDSNILSNFVADARDSDTMIDRYNRNQIYNENNALTPDSVANACPALKIIKIDCPHFTNDKKDYVKNTTVECIHKGGDSVLDNWKFLNAYHSGQGTTSNEYGYAGRNMDIICCADGVNQINSKIPLDPEYITELILGDGTKYSDGSGKVTLTRNSVPNNWFNIKVNIASSENANNALLAKRFNDYLPYTSVAQAKNANAKNTMEFVNCIVFIRENDPDITQHREFQDTDWHYYAIGNMGDSKNTDKTRVADANDHNEFVIEIADNTKPNSIFPSGVENSDGVMLYPISSTQWVAGNPAYDSLMNDWGETYEFRYEHPDITDEEQAANIKVWNDFYKWVITSSNANFVSQLENWFIKDSALYFYLFTERYTMIDNRAKNTFWHWSKVYISQAEATTMGEDAKYYTVNDTAAGINNGYRFEMWDYDNDRILSL